jgi:vacuolar-type H+-ATPase subunit I/STV1
MRQSGAKPIFNATINAAISIRFLKQKMIIQAEGDAMPDQFNLSGDFRGAVINIKSTLKDVQQSVGEISTNDENARRDLEKLIQQLSGALQKIPAAKQEDAQAVAETAKALVDSAKAEKPNKSMLKITSEGLKQAAQNLADVMPAVIPIAGQIALTVMKLVGG